MSVHVAGDLNDVLDHLSSATDVTLLAGGTDLMVDLNFGRKRPERVVAIDRVPELARLERNG
ncbi:MAG TPA: FAD binding domain-containing protein, partial [Candidatus Limnocylindria bacterium]